MQVNKYVYWNRLYTRQRIILLLTILYVGYFHTFLYIREYQAINISLPKIWWTAAIDIFVKLIQVYCFLYAITAARAIWWIVWPLLCMISAFDNYAFLKYGTKVTKNVVELFFHANSEEAHGFIAADLQRMFFFPALLALFGIWLRTRETKTDANTKKAVLFAWCMIFCLCTFGKVASATLYPPYDILTATCQYLYSNLTSKNVEDLSRYSASRTASGSDPLVIVLALGESARGDHFHINGYNRQNTPLMEKQKNLVNFPHMTSCGVFTHVSVPCLMTRSSPDNKRPNETSFISIFRKLGFYTAWYSAQPDHIGTMRWFPIVLEANNYTLLSDKNNILHAQEYQFKHADYDDADLLPLLDDALAKNLHKNILIVLHTYGSHWYYSERYPKNFERFVDAGDSQKTLSYRSQDGGNLQINSKSFIAQYDNSILYTDYILDLIIKRLEKRNALFVYTSDHGESLGEEGRWLHGHEDAPEDYNIPMFWWASDGFIADNLLRWKQLKEKTALPVNHFYIFHSILDCAGGVIAGH